MIASKRGRSHAHEGTFRDDDFAIEQLSDNWSIVALADGAGSSRASRAGSQFVTNRIVKSFDDYEFLQELSNEVQNFYSEELEEFITEEVIESMNHETSENLKLKSKSIIINKLYTKVKHLHSDIINFAETEALDLKDLHTTLIFTLIKKFSFGYVILSFGVGDCPINVLEKKDDNVKLLNFLDIGEFGGGTRFITMPEIFSNPDMVNRFRINCFKDFSKIFLMTDGIYDPKFIVESKLENIDTWKQFLRDLDGENEDKIKVDFENDTEIKIQLSNWMDFWSKGNHDDRTLAIIY
ncbi:PP2C family serine/threonine-protein phosphatase [Chishuiella sp.]|uniref:PP2C family serine/threonine-protein phosphatase n=1 Tax=Chishuiella sp. TaxID=1969467 RepID=UPI0028AB267B|nr:PP2C family serine/threonine-protein phosphatase [Chishuiella sp.]